MSCSLFVVCCLLYDVRCLVVCWLVFVVCRNSLIVVVCFCLRAVRCWCLFVVCCTVFFAVVVNGCRCLWLFAVIRRCLLLCVVAWCWLFVVGCVARCGVCRVLVVGLVLAGCCLLSCLCLMFGCV